MDLTVHSTRGPGDSWKPEVLGVLGVPELGPTFPLCPNYST